MFDKSITMSRGCKLLAMQNRTNKEREFIERLQEELPELLGGKVAFEALVGNILFANGDCVGVGRRRKRIFTQPKKRHRKI
jgi:hypothetical protein